MLDKATRETFDSNGGMLCQEILILALIKFSLCQGKILNFVNISTLCHVSLCQFCFGEIWRFFH